MYSKLALCLTNNIQSNFLFSRTIFVLQFHFLVLSFSTKWLPKCFSFTRIQFLVDRVINCFTQKISYSTLTSLIIKGFLDVFFNSTYRKFIGKQTKICKVPCQFYKIVYFYFHNLFYKEFAMNRICEEQVQVKCVRCTFVKFLSDSSCCLCSTIPARKISITFQHCCCCKKIIFEFHNKYMNKNRSNNKYSDDNILSLLPCKVAMHNIRMFCCFVSNFGWFAHLTSHCIFW